MRSGTTLFARVLGQHPDVSAFSNTGVIQDEGQFLQSVFPVSSHAYGGPGRFAFDAAAHFTEASPLLTKDNKATLKREWNEHWDLDKAVLVEKTPMNILKSRFLNEVFPDSHFIFLIRHPIAVSIATQKWSGTSIYALINHWLVAHETLRDDLKFLPRFTILPYEIFMADPEPVLRTIESVLGLRKSAYKFRLDKHLNENYFNIWNKHFRTKTGRNNPIVNQGRVTAPPADRPLPSKGMHYLVRVPQGSGGLFAGPSEMLLTNPTFEAEDAIAQFGGRVRNFGYSLDDLALRPQVKTK